MPSANLRRKALDSLLLCTAFWALSFPLMKVMALAQHELVPGASSWFLSSLCVMVRFLMAGVLLLVFSPVRLRELSRRELEQGMLLALFTAVGMCLQTDGLAYISASTSAFLTQLYCVLIPLWIAVSRRCFPTLKISLCGGLILSGMILLVRLNFFAFRLGRGELETLASSVMFTAQILCLEQPRYATNRPQYLTTVMLLAIGFFTAPVALLAAPNLAACVQAFGSVPVCGVLAILVLLCSIAPFLLMNRWQREVTATEAGLVYCAEPVLASLAALFLPGCLSLWTGAHYANEQLTLRLLVGGGLITAANILLQSRWLDPKPFKS